VCFAARLGDSEESGSVPRWFPAADALVLGAAYEAWFERYHTPNLLTQLERKAGKRWELVGDVGPVGMA